MEVKARDEREEQATYITSPAENSIARIEIVEVRREVAGVGSVGRTQDDGGSAQIISLEYQASRDERQRPGVV